MGKIFAIKDADLPEVLKNEIELQHLIYHYLNLNIASEDLFIDYDHFADDNSYNLILKICNQLHIPLKQIRAEGLRERHEHKLLHSYKDNENKFNSWIWYCFSKNSSEQKNYIRELRRLKNEITTQLETLFQTSNLIYKLEVNYDDIINSIAGNILKGFEPSILLYEPIILYHYLLNQYNIDKNELKDEVLSLLYFENNEEIIENAIKEIVEYTEEVAKIEGIAIEEDEEFTVVSSSLVKIEKRNGSKKSSYEKTGWKSSKRDDENNRKIGENAEKNAYKALIKKFGKNNVKWVSANSDTPHRSDSLHYDFEYKNVLGIWKKLEVKNYNGNYFKISKDEINLGISNPDEYEIGLVEGLKLHIVSNLFIFDSKKENFWNNSKFTVETNNYTIYYNIITHD